MKLSRRVLIIKDKINYSKKYELLEGISVLKQFSSVRFIESFDVAVCLGIESKKSEQNIRGHVVLPHGHGRSVHVLAFTEGKNINLAEDAGAVLAGLDNVIHYIKDKRNKFDVVVATPDVMPKVSQLGVILGPRGLMPNPKFGTVSQNIVEVIKRIRTSQIRYRNDKYGIVHASIGRVNFDIYRLRENLESLVMDLKKNKPVQSKGVYIKKVVISSTMGPGIQIDQGTLF